MIEHIMSYYSQENMRCYTKSTCLWDIYGVIDKEMAFQLNSSLQHLKNEEGKIKIWSFDKKLVKDLGILCMRL